MWSLAKKHSYDIFMTLIQLAYLGTGHHLLLDSFNSSPQLFLVLPKIKFGAGGMYWDNRKVCPNGPDDALT